MSYHGAQTPDGVWIISKRQLTLLVEDIPHEVVITKTEPQQYAGPLPLGPERIAVGGPDPEEPDWIAVIRRQPDGSWQVL